jgi:hypothetical protein
VTNDGVKESVQVIQEIYHLQMSIYQTFINEGLEC